MAEAKPTEDPNTLSVSYDDIKGRGRPAGWTAEKHATHDETGAYVIWAPPAITGLALVPGEQINYRRDDDGNVLAYSKGPYEGGGLHIEPAVSVESEPEPEEPWEVPDDREITPGHPTPTSATPQPQAATTGLTPEPQASSTDGIVTLQDQSNTSPAGQGLDDLEAGELQAEAVEEATDDPTTIEGHEDDEVAYPVEGDNGWYELSDGNKVRGQKAAEKAQAKLDQQG